MTANDSSSTVEASLSKRRLLGIAAAGATGAGGLLVATGDRGRAAADVELGTVQVSDASFESESVVPVVDVQVTYDYDVGNSDVGDLRVELLADGDVIAFEELVTDTESLRNDTTLAGRVAEASAWSQSDFTVDVGESVTRDVTVGVRFAVRDTSGTVIDDATAESVVGITVEHPRDMEWSVQVGAVGEVRTPTG